MTDSVQFELLNVLNENLAADKQFERMESKAMKDGKNDDLFTERSPSNGNIASEDTGCEGVSSTEGVKSAGSDVAVQDDLIPPSTPSASEKNELQDVGQEEAGHHETSSSTGMTTTQQCSSSIPKASSTSDAATPMESDE